MDVANLSDARGWSGLLSSTWVSRLRVLLAVGLVWAGLHFVINRTVLTTGLDRPVVIVASQSGALAGIALAILIWLTAFAGSLLAGIRDATRLLFVVGAGLALWSCGGGTMDDWLLLKNPLVAGPRSAPYWPLLADYVVLGVVVAGVAALGNLLSAERPGTDVRKALGLDALRVQWRAGVPALLTTTAVATFLLFVLTGPRIGHTWRGQVFFAVAVAFGLGVAVARRLTHVRQPIWYWPAPLIVGIAGVLLAVFQPALPPPFERLDMIPAWGLVRPLPVEMVGVGLAAIAWTLRASERLSEEAGAS